MSIDTIITNIYARLDNHGKCIRRIEKWQWFVSGAVIGNTALTIVGMLP